LFAEALVAEAEKVDRALRQLVDAAASGDIAAAKALIPWLNQAFGMPQERVQRTTPSTLEELEQMDTGQLEELVAKGRERRLSKGRLHVVDERLSR
jgi:ribulose kinase